MLLFMPLIYADVFHTNSCYAIRYDDIVTLRRLPFAAIRYRLMLRGAMLRWHATPFRRYAIRCARRCRASAFFADIFFCRVTTPRY